MTDLTTHESQAGEALPGEFDFYGLGIVAPEGAAAEVPWEEAARGLAGRVAYGFELNALGDLGQAVLIVSFDEGLDESAYAEMGNIIAARLSQALNRDGGAMISPPIRLTDAAVARMRSRGDRAFARTYLHAAAAGVVEIDAHVLVPARTRENHA